MKICFFTMKINLKLEYIPIFVKISCRWGLKKVLRTARCIPFQWQIFLFAFWIHFLKGFQTVKYGNELIIILIISTKNVYKNLGTKIIFHVLPLFLSMSIIFAIIMLVFICMQAEHQQDFMCVCNVCVRRCQCIM